MDGRSLGARGASGDREGAGDHRRTARGPASNFGTSSSSAVSSALPTASISRSPWLYWRSSRLRASRVASIPGRACGTPPCVNLLLALLFFSWDVGDTIWRYSVAATAVFAVIILVLQYSLLVESPIWLARKGASGRSGDRDDPHLRSASRGCSSRRSHPGPQSGASRYRQSAAGSPRRLSAAHDPCGDRPD